MQLVLVRDRAAWQDHAVLPARIDQRWLIPDSRHSELLEDTAAATLTPLYAIDHRGVRLFTESFANWTPRADDAAAGRAATDDGAEWAAAASTP